MSKPLTEGKMNMEDINKQVAKEIRRIIRELEMEGFDEDVDTFKSWLLFECDALENDGVAIRVLK